MRAYLSLLRVYLSSTYDLGTFLGWFRQGPKGIAKGLGAVLLFLYVLAAMGFMLLLISFNTYVALEPFGLQAMVLQNGVITATALSWIFGLITCLATYFMSGAEGFLLSLPLGPRALFGAKFSLVYASEAALAVLMVAVSAGVYAYFELPGPLYYVYALLAALLTPLLPMAVCYFLVIPLMTALRFLRRRDTVMILGGILGVGLAVGWQLLNQRIMLNMRDTAWVLANLADPDSAMARLAAAYPPARWAASAMGAGAAGVLDFLRFAGLQLLALALAVILLSGPYVRSLTRFDESPIARLRDPRAYIGAGFRSRSQFAAGLKREFLVMLREPAYFINGPFVVILMPAIFAAMYMGMREEFLKDMPFLAQPEALSLMSVVAMGFAAFLGSMTSINATAVSREGKQLQFLKSLPLAPLPFFGAKLAHGLIYSALGSLVGAGFIVFVSRLGFARALLSAFAGFGISSLLGVLGLALDTAIPRLDWPNPTVAIKQNPTAIAASLGGMAMVVGISVLAYFFRDWPPLLPFIGACGCAAAALAFRLYLPWAAKRLDAIE